MSNSESPVPAPLGDEAGSATELLAQHASYLRTVRSQRIPPEESQYLAVASAIDETLAALTAARAECAADRERLDWLERMLVHCDVDLWKYGHDDGDYVCDVDGCEPEERRSCRAKSLREAIDAARHRQEMR